MATGFFVIYSKFDDYPLKIKNPATMMNIKESQIKIRFLSFSFLIIFLS